MRFQSQKIVAVTLILVLGITALGSAVFLGSGVKDVAAFSKSVVQNLTALAVGNSSCTLNGATVSSGGSKTFYLVPSVPAGFNCASVGVSRSCQNGALTGTSTYTYPSCYVDASLSQVRTGLKAFVPYVWSTTWYPWFSDTVRTDPENRGLALFKEHVPLIKAQGFNTVWLGGFAWFYLQPTPGVWNANALKALKAHLDVLKQHNMRAIFQLNFVGQGFSPQGINSCNWMNDPAQVKKFNEFVTALGGELAKYNSMIYYSVFTEQTLGCLIARGQFNFYKGIRINPDGTSVSVNRTEQAPAQYADTHAVNTMLKNSIGRLTKDLPPAVRAQMFIGIHDADISNDQITDATPVHEPIDFDFFSFAFYPSNTELNAFPSDTALGNGGTDTPIGAAAYTDIINKLDTDKNRILPFHPDTPILMGEFGWQAWDQNLKVPTLKQDSPARNIAFAAMIDWSITRKIGFNAWTWIPRYLDDPSRDSVVENSHSLHVRDSKIMTATPTPTTVLATIKERLLGTRACSYNGSSVAHGSSVTGYQNATVPYGQTCVSESRTCTNGTLSGSYANASCSVLPLTTLSASCSTNGTQGTFSWTPVEGNARYYLNVYDTNTQSYVKGPNALVSSPETVATTPGRTYTSWMYVATSSKWSSSIGTKPFTCPVPVSLPCSYNGSSVAHGSSVTGYQNATVPYGQTCVSESRTCTNGTLSGSYANASCSVLPLTTLSASCSTNGTQGTFSWTPVEGASAYYLNVYDATIGQYVQGPNALATNPTNITTVPGNTYTSWVYVVTSSGWSGANGAPVIKCPAP